MGRNILGGYDDRRFDDRRTPCDRCGSYESMRDRRDRYDRFDRRDKFDRRDRYDRRDRFNRFEDRDCPGCRSNFFRFPRFF